MGVAYMCLIHVASSSARASLQKNSLCAFLTLQYDEIEKLLSETEREDLQGTKLSGTATLPMFQKSYSYRRYSGQL